MKYPIKARLANQHTIKQPTFLFGIQHLLDIPEDPTTPVLALNTSPPATPVLHLTDEEDAQTQDTQDLSQEF